MAKYDLCPVRRPFESADAAILRGQFAHFAFAVCVLCDRHHIQAGHLDVLVHPAKIVSALIVFFLVIRLGVGHRISYPTAIGRPFKIADAAFQVCRHLSLAARHPEKIEIILVVLASRCKRDPFTIRRPFWIGRRFVGKCELHIVFAVGCRKPDLRHIFALVGRHHLIGNRVSDPFPIGRNTRSSDGFDLELHLGRPCCLGRCNSGSESN